MVDKQISSLMIVKYIIITRQPKSMKHLCVTLDYGRFEVIPTGVTRTKLISVKPLILFIIPQSICLFECT